MKRVWFLSVTLILVTFLSTSTFYVLQTSEQKIPEDFFFGVSYGGDTVDEAKLLIDRVKEYTNFFIVNNWDISTDEAALNEVCDYAAKSGLSFIVFFDFVSLGKYVPPYFDMYPWHENWVLTAKERWGDKFLGIYIYEEPGGKQIDTKLFDEFFHSPRANIFENVTTYSEAADVFVTELPSGLSFHWLQNGNIPRFVSDYALYWYDYLAGYDTVFAELGWNHSTPQHIGLVRGAANAQGKDWGAIITWTYWDPPYLASGTKIYEEMVSAYESGAKYVVVFNYPKFPEDNPYGVLNDGHFAAMRQFWKYVQAHPEAYGKTGGDVAFVLPKDYGWGMRFPEDSIWGLWDADKLSPIIWENMNKLIEKYGQQLDIVYDDPRFNYENYRQIYLWNTTIN
jgi:hypothetical protein